MAVRSTQSTHAPSLTDGLNPEQRTAVETCDGPLLILAGAGSGKTSVLTRRIAWLLEQNRANPWNILAITFTNKAAREMNDRVKRLVGHAAQDIWTSTFHSMCVKLLRREAVHAGLEHTFSILDADDQLAAIKQSMLDLNHDLKKFDPSAIQWKISAAKNELLTPVQMERTAGRSVIDSVAADVYHEYQARLQQMNVLDFDDLIFRTVRMFEEHPGVLAAYQEKFRYIHVDEYQDTNHAQYRLVKLLADGHRNICVVGDADQAIYRWRGADIANILNFERDYQNAVVIKLEQNYRSTTTILEAANAVIRHNTARREKRLWSDAGRGEPISVYTALDQSDEATYVVAKVQEHVGNGGKFGDCTVLYRANALSRAIEEALLGSAIPYKIIGGMTFYDRREIRDVMAYLKTLANPQDEISLLRIVNAPKRNIGDNTIRQLLDYAHTRNLTLLEAMGHGGDAGLTPRSAAAAHAFHAMMTRLHEMQEGLSVTEYVELVLRETGYREAYARSSKEDDKNRLENIDELLTVTKSFDRRRRGTLVDFLAETSLLSDIDRESGKQDNAVRLMTMHAAKGLEFPVVFLVGAEETIFPHARSMDTAEDVEEERNLCYVAITRARQKLHVSYCVERAIFGQVRMNDPSRFVREIPPSLVQAEAGQAREAVHWSIGASVRHPQFGVGIVTDLAGDEDDVTLTITFPSRHGTKSVKPANTRLRVLD